MSNLIHGKLEHLRDDLFFLYLHDVEEPDSGFYDDWQDECPKLCTWIKNNKKEFREANWDFITKKFRDELDEMVKKDEKQRHLKEIHDASLQYD